MKMGQKMELIVEKNLCCGCSSCANICPQHCITMTADIEGFLYPHINQPKCIDCGLCKSACPILNTKKQKLKHDLNVFIGKNPDENIRSISSSGGVFTLLAEKTISKQGVVFGAQFTPDFRVIHDFVDDKNGLKKLRGSKYVQSEIGHSYKVAKRFLDEGRQVLFSGTPCQIAGLKRHLKHDYNNLLTIDIVCHGTPSYKVLNKYLTELIDKQERIKEICFRDKITGWKNYSITIQTEDRNGETKSLSTIYTKDKYMSAFLSNLSIRPSCFNCRFKGENSQSDITLGDSWGLNIIHPEIDDNKGHNLIISHNEKGDKYINEFSPQWIKSTIQEIIKYNEHLIESARVQPNRKLFFSLIRNNSFIKCYSICFGNNILYRIFRLLYRLIY